MIRVEYSKNGVSGQIIFDYSGWGIEVAKLDIPRALMEEKIEFEQYNIVEILPTGS